MNKTYIGFLKDIQKVLSEKYPNKKPILYINGISLCSKFTILITVKGLDKLQFIFNIHIYNNDSNNITNWNKSILIEKTSKEKSVIKIIEFLLDE